MTDEPTSRPGEEFTGAVQESGSDAEDDATRPSGRLRQRRFSNGLIDNERRLLAQMKTADGLAHVIERGLGPEVFHDPITGTVFRWIIEDYWPIENTPPTTWVLDEQFPAVEIPHAADVEETTEWLVGWLQNRHVRTRMQEITLTTFKAPDLDNQPATALRSMRDALDELLEQTGRGPGESAFDHEFLRADELNDLPDAQSLVEDVLTRHTYGILRGRDQSFKSFIALDWALCMATGTHWQGKATDHIRVLYVAGEGAYGIGERKQAWESAQGIAVDPKWFAVRKSAVNLFRPGAEFEHLLRYVREGEFGLVVFDTLRRMSGGAGENGSDMGVVVDNLDRVKRHTADGSVLAVAHTDKGDRDARGFSGIEDDADIVWSVKREAGTNEVRLTCAKMKDGPDGHQFHLRLKPEAGSLVVQDATNDRKHGLFREDNQSDQLIMSTMREIFAAEGATVPDLVEMTGLSRPSVYRSRARLVQSGRLRANKAHRLFVNITDEAEDS